MSNYKKALQICRDPKSKGIKQTTTAMIISGIGVIYSSMNYHSEAIALFN